MGFDSDQIAELKQFYPELSEQDEGGQTLILISNLKLPDGCTPEVVDALLFPFTRDNYPSRLYLSQKITHKGEGLNWAPPTGAIIGNRQWWAVSWHTHQVSQRLLGMVTAHLQAFVCKK
jgi:hypothetical protein